MGPVADRGDCARRGCAGRSRTRLSAADRPTLAFVDASHIRASVVWTFSLVVEVADQRRLKELTLGQFADYAAMVALAKITPSARLGDAPTILKLFDGSPKAAPARMTDWDRAFLKSLYSTPQKSILQRSEIAQDMVREVSP